MHIVMVFLNLNFLDMNKLSQRLVSVVVPKRHVAMTNQSLFFSKNVCMICICLPSMGVYYRNHFLPALANGKINWFTKFKFTM